MEVLTDFTASVSVRVSAKAITSLKAFFVPSYDFLLSSEILLSEQNDDINFTAQGKYLGR